MVGSKKPASSFDVVVVGAGPAGCVAALQAARLRCGSVLLLDRAEFPRDKTCAGGLSPRTCRVLQDLGLWGDVTREAYPIRAARLVSPGGREAFLTSRPHGAVLSRRRFDQLLADAAVREGVAFQPGRKVDELVEDEGHVVGVRCGSDEVAARHVIVASGGNSRLVRDPRPLRRIHTCMAWYENVRVTPNAIEIIYDRELLPYYGWVFPESQGRANVGVAAPAGREGSRTVRDLFASFLQRRLAGRLAGARPGGPWKGLLLSTCADVRHHAPPGALVVGEANRLVNSASGEGILYAMLSGRLAAEAIRRGGERGLDAHGVGRLYERALRGSCRWTFARADFYCKLAARGLDPLVAVGSLPPVARLLGRLFLRL
jgi:geranylgeranyl reductase family protein